MLTIGLMSGTSLDGVDGVLARFEADPAETKSAGPATPTTSGRGNATPSSAAPSGPPAPFESLAFASRPMPAALRDALFALQAPGPDELARAADAAVALAELQAEVVEALLAQTGVGREAVAAIGAHGQTVRHRPERGWTLQINAPAHLAERCGIAVVADLRSRDVAAGGQGAPLVPPFHARAFGHPTERRVVVNLGGMANVSTLGDAAVRGWDCGPANALMDGWCERHLGERFDANGRWAASGRVIPPLLARLRAEPWFALPPPKSTGRDLFDLAWLDRAIADCAAPAASRSDGDGRPLEYRASADPGAATAAWEPADVQATLLELTATTVADACRPSRPDRVLLCGGGAANGALVRRLASLLAPAAVEPTDAVGVPAQAVEALAFAWLAHRHLTGVPANAPEVTGARGSRPLGALWPR